MSTKTNPSKLLNTATQNRVPFSVVEAYKSLRVHLVSLLENYNGKIVAISSPNASEGKTTTAINTAITLSQLNKKVIIIDTDSRRPSVHQKLKLANNIGCLDIILGKAKFEDAVKNYNPYLDVLTVGTTSGQGELFSSLEFDKLLLELRDKYDYIIVDTPPVNLVSDSLVVSQKCDGLVLVVRAGVTAYDAFNETMNNIKRLNIKLFGTVMNGIQSDQSKYKKY